MANNETCLACNFESLGLKKGKTPHLYNRNCRLKIQKSVVPDKPLEINDWFKHINSEVKTALYKK